MKCGLFAGAALKETRRFDEGDLSELQKWLAAFPIEHVISCKVGSLEIPTSVYDKLPGLKISLDHHTPIPFNNLYESKETLGMDRLAGVAGAWHLKPSQASLVIDMGTAITYDFIDKDGNYEGGGISPGMRLRFKALNAFTAKLPLVKANEKDFPLSLIGKNTVTSIESGVMLGCLAEMEGMIARYRDVEPQTAVFLTGGDAPLFASSVKSQIFANPDLVLVGLNSILNYNVV